MTEIGKDAENDRRVLVMTIKPAEPGIVDSRIAIRKLTLERGLSSAFANFNKLLLNLGGVVSDPDGIVTASQAILDFVHIGRLRKESGNGKKDAP